MLLKNWVAKGVVSDVNDFNSTCHQVLLFCTLGNGICDGDANIGGACEFDGGDCCQPIIDNSGCANETCLCYDDWSLHFTLAGKIKFHRKFICLRFIYFMEFCEFYFVKVHKGLENLRLNNLCTNFGCRNNLS